MLETSSALIQS